MVEEIRQDDKVILSSEDGFSVPICMRLDASKPQYPIINLLLKFLFHFYRYIHLVTACGIVRLRHFQYPCTNHRIDIDLHKIFPIFQS